MRVRLLPVTMGAMAVLAAVKTIGLATTLLLPAKPGVRPADSRAGLVSTAFAAEHAAAKPQAAAPVKTAPPPDPGPAAPTSPPVSEAERAILQDLRTRREALDARTAALDDREGLIKAAQKGIEERVNQLAAMQTRLEAMEKLRSEREESNWRGLVKTYEAMRPRDAAAIFNELDQAILLEVLDRMKEAKAASVLAAMQPDRARVITAKLAEWRQRTTGGSKG